MATGRMEFAGAAPATGLASGILAGDLTFNLLSGTGYPTGAVGKFVLALDPGSATEEKVLCTARSGVAVTVDPAGRGYDNTTAQSHSSGTVNVEHVVAATQMDDANAHTYVTTRDDHSQYARTDGSRAVTGTQSFVNTTNSGTLAVTGTITGSSTVQATAHIATLTGTNGRYVGATNGAPVSGTYLTNDFADDPTNLTFWICTAGGTPGTWVAVPGVTDAAWTAVSTFTNSWSNQGAPYFNAGWRKVNGRVYLRGVVKSGTIGSSMFTLPSGYRPANSIAFNPQSPNTGNGGLITIASTGTVIYSIGAGPLQVSLDGIDFDTLS